MTEPTGESKAPRRVTPHGVLVLAADVLRTQRHLWLEARRYREDVDGGWCIGASDAPSILNLPDCGTPREVYHEKVTLATREETEAMRWGRLHEQTIAREWQHRRRTVVRNVGLVSNVDDPWLQCTLDRRVVTCPDSPELNSRCALEVKTRGAHRPGRFHAEAPDDITAQCMVQMMVTGYRHIHTAILVGGSELYDPVVWWDQDIADYLMRELSAFRNDFLIPKVEPAWSYDKPEKEIRLDLLLHPDRVGQLGINTIADVIAYDKAAMAAGARERARKAALARLVEISGGKQTLVFNGEIAVYWREGVHTSTDYDVLARYPEAYAAAVRTKKTYTIVVNKQYKGLELGST